MQPVNQWKNNIKNQSHSVVWLTAFVLAVLVVATVSVVGACLYKYVHHSDCEISLYDGQVAEPVKTAKNASAQMAANPVIQSKATQYKGTQAKQQLQKSSFNVTDAEQVWKTETAIELFKAEYTNANGEVTVKSADGRKVIAPGTEGSYTFSLKNTGNASADYKIWVEAELSSDMTGVPLQTRMSSDSGWLLGGKNSWEQAEDLDGVSTSESIGAGKTAEYTIYWQWPFERGDDAADTALGNEAVSQEMTYTVTIYTLTASATGGDSTDQTDESNQTNQPNQKEQPKKNFWNAVKTGDYAQVMLWIVVLIISAGVVIYLVILKKRKNDRENEHKESGQ